MKRHRRDYEVMSDMNLTNLLDTAFVLLIAFIMASPTMRTGLNVNLPEVAPPGTMNQAPLSKVIAVSIKKSEVPGQEDPIYLDGNNRVTYKDLNDTLTGMKSITNQKIDVVIEVDQDARFNVLAKVLAILKRQGIDSVGLPMLPDENQTFAPQTPAPGAVVPNKVKKTNP